jgi:hypothetical protein
MGAFNTDKKFHGKITAYADDWNTSVAHTTQDPLNCEGYTKLMIYYYAGGASAWDRAGTVTVYGALRSTDTFVAMDATNESASFGVLTTDDAGEIYVVENVPPFIKLDWANTTAGTTGTLTVLVMPFND